MKKSRVDLSSWISKCNITHRYYIEEKEWEKSPARTPNDNDTDSNTDTNNDTNNENENDIKLRMKRIEEKDIEGVKGRERGVIKERTNVKWEFMLGPCYCWESSRLFIFYRGRSKLRLWIYCNASNIYRFLRVVTFDLSLIFYFLFYTSRHPSPVNRHSLSCFFFFFLSQYR